MKAFKRTLIYALILMLFIVSGCKKQENNRFAEHFSYNLLQEGDIVFRRGIGVVSQLVITADQASEYSHIGIVVLSDNTWKVVHAVPGDPDFNGDPDRIKMDDVHVFFREDRARTGALMRVLADSTLRSQAAKHAIHLFQSGILFDHSYNLDDSSQMYCTEFIDYVYKHQGVDLKEDRSSHIHIPGLNGNYILPSHIQQSSLLCMIYNF